MNKINENDILETTLSIAENEYSEAYRSFTGIRRTVHRQEQIWNRSLEKTASGRLKPSKVPNRTAMEPIVGAMMELPICR